MSISSTEADNVEIGKYSKTWHTLSKLECVLLSKFYLKFHDKTHTREQIIRLIFIKQPELQQNTETKLLAFEIYVKPDDDKARRIKVIDIAEPDELEYPKRTGKGARINIDDIIADLALDDTEDDIVVKDEIDLPPPAQAAQGTKGTGLPLPKLHEKFYTPFAGGPPAENFKPDDPEAKFDPVNVSIVTAIGQITDKLVAIEGRKNKNFISSKNLRYDNDEGVDSFLRMIEIASRGQNLTRDEDKVALAHQVLSQSAQGSQLLGLCSSEDVSSWQKFSTRLMSMQGLSAKSYELKFLSATRKPGQSSPMFMAKLIDCYKRSQECPDDYELNRFESRSVLMRFCQALEPQLKNLLQDRLSTAKMSGNEIYDLDQVATLCQQLETCFELGSHAKAKVNAITDKPAQVSETTSLINLMKEQINQIKKLTAAEKESAGSDKKPISDHTQLQGYCLWNLKGDCGRSHCKFKHTPAPIDVIEHFNANYFQNERKQN